MSIKALFLNYVEHQKTANEIKAVKGFSHPSTIEAYEKANRLKRMILEQLEELEGAI